MVPTDRPRPEPELLLPGSDRPRPLPLELRARLEGLLTKGGTEQARALPDRARERVLDSLPAPSSASGWRRGWGLSGRVVGTAAAVVVALGVGLPVLARPQGHGAPLSAIGMPSAAPQMSPVPAHRPLGMVVPGPRPSGQPRASGDDQSRGSGEAAGSTRASRTSTSVSKTRHRPDERALFGPATRRSVASGTVEYGATEAQAPLSTNREALSLSPAGGPAAGGNWVVVDGLGLGGADAVTFGPVAAARVQVTSSHQLRVLAPRHRPGEVSVVVVVDGQPTLSDLRYRYR